MAFWHSLISINKPESSKSFTLVVSAIVSAIVGLCICFILVWDVIHNGYIKTNMEDMGIFMLCMGGYLAGGSVSKVFNSNKYERIAPYLENNEEMENEDDTYEPRRRKRRRSQDDYYDTCSDTDNSDSDSESNQEDSPNDRTSKV